MRVAIYLRVSTDDQADKYGLPAQLRACREYAATRGWSIIAEISDEGVSGVILERPGLDRVRNMAREKAIDVVLMYDADRLSRELAHLLILKPEIEKNCQLEFVAAKFEDSPSGRMFFGIRGVIAQYEREVIRERTGRGMKERARSGLLVGGRAPYGYVYDAGRLVPDEKRAEIAKEIYNWCDAGLSVREVVRRLRAAGAPTWSGRAMWSPQAVLFILRNEAYIGTSYFGKSIPVLVPSLIEKAQWDRVQARLSGKARVGRPSPTFLLRGLIYCSCGRKMSGERHRKSHAYRCSRRDPLQFIGGPCQRGVNAAKLDAAAWLEVSRTLTDAALLRSMLSSQVRELRGVSPKNLAAMESQSRKLRGQEEAALSLMLDPDFADERASIRARYQAARLERMRLESEVAAIQRANRSTMPDREWIGGMVDVLRADLPRLSPEKRQEFVRRVMRRSDWNGEEISMQIFIAPELTKASGHICQFEPLQLVLKARLAA